VFGNPDHPAVTIHFLNAILGDRPKITHVEFLSPILGQEKESEKLSILDIRAIDEHGRKLNIEMQTTVLAAMSQRLTFYAARLYVAQFSEGSPYATLRPAITICVLAKSMFLKLPRHRQAGKGPTR